MRRLDAPVVPPTRTTTTIFVIGGFSCRFCSPFLQPHINLVFPYVEAGAGSDLEAVLERALSSIAPFELELKSFSLFAGRGLSLRAPAPGHARICKPELHL